MPRAFGSANYAEIGRLAIRSVFVCSCLMAPVLIALSQAPFVKQLLQILGQDSVVAAKTASWIQLYLLGVPANLLFRTTQRFFVAQHRPWPPVLASLAPSLVTHHFLLNHLVPTYGLSGSAMAIVLSQWMMCLLLFIQLRIFRQSAYEPASWPGVSATSIKEALAIEPLVKFIRLSIGGVAALSEWWFWEIMCFIAGTFGVVQLCAHSIVYNVIPMCFMIPLGMSIGLSVRMGTVLAYDSRRAKRMAASTLILAIIFGMAVASLLYAFQVPIIGLFTKDEAVANQCYAIWGRVCCYVCVLYVFGINGGILRALGMQWTMAAVLGVTLWCITLPSIVWFSIHEGGGFNSQWTLLPIAYTLVQFCLASCYIFYDWERRSTEIRDNANNHLTDFAFVNEQQVLLTEAESML